MKLVKSKAIGLKVHRNTANCHSRVLAAPFGVLESP